MRETIEMSSNSVENKGRKAVVSEFRMTLYIPGFKTMLHSLNRDKMISILSSIEYELDGIFKDYDLKTERAIGDIYTVRSDSLEKLLACAGDVTYAVESVVENSSGPVILVADANMSNMAIKIKGFSVKGLYLPLYLLDKEGRIKDYGEAGKYEFIKTPIDHEKVLFRRVEKSDFAKRLEQIKKNNGDIRGLRSRLQERSIKQKRISMMRKAAAAITFVLISSGFVFNPEKTYNRRIQAALRSGRLVEAEVQLKNLASIYEPDEINDYYKFREVSSMLGRELSHNLFRFGRNREALALSEAWDARGYPEYPEMRRKSASDLISGLMMTGKGDEAMNLMYKVLSWYPTDSEMLTVIARQCRSARKSEAIYVALEAALRLARLTGGILESWHGDALFAALERVDPELQGHEIRTILINRWERVRERARIALDSENMILRENAVLLLQEMGDLTDLELVRHRLKSLNSINRYQRMEREIFNKSLKYVREQMEFRDWKQRCAASGLEVPEKVMALM